MPADDVENEDTTAASTRSLTSESNGRMWASIMVAMVGAMMFGLDQGNFGNVQGFPSFRAEWCEGNFGNKMECDADHIQNNEAWQKGIVLWGATLITFGAAGGALLIGPYVMGNLGRRFCVGLGGGICFLGCLVASYLSVPHVWVFYIGRVITGLGVGISCFALPVYNAEISVPQWRGATGSMFQLNVVIGSFIATLITKFDHHWSFGMVLPGIAGAILAVAAPFLPESPRFVFEKKDKSAGIKELKKIRTGNVEAEADDIMQLIEEERHVRPASYADMIVGDSNLRKRFLISCTLVLAQQATGVNAFLGYADHIFTMAGIDNPLLFNLIWNFVMIIGCSIGLVLVDSPIGGRRIQLLGASAIMGPPLLLAATSLLFKWPGMILMVCVILYGVGFQVAWGTVPWIYPAEIFNMNEKGTAVSIAVCLNYLGNAAVVLVGPYLMDWSIIGTFYMYGVLNMICMAFVWAFVVETKGKSLEEIPNLFKGKLGEKDPRRPAVRKSTLTPPTPVGGSSS